MSQGVIKITDQTVSEQSLPQLLEAPKAPPIPPVLERIAWCESKSQHYDQNGKVLRGVNHNDMGKYQINTKVWGAKAEQMGYDLSTEEGNEAMAVALYHKYRGEPWNSSRYCWERS